MSNVLERFRSTSDFQILTDAEKLCGLAMTWLLNEKNVPKRKRGLFQQDLQNLTRSLVRHIRDAEYSYPQSVEKMNVRKKEIDDALLICTDLWDEFKFIDYVLRINFEIDLDKLEPILTLLLNIQNSLKKWRNNLKLISTKD